MLTTIQRVVSILVHIAVPLMILAALTCVLSAVAIWRVYGLATPIWPLAPAVGFLMSLVAYRAVSRSPLALVPVPLYQMAIGWVTTVLFSGGILLLARHFASKA